MRFRHDWIWNYHRVSRRWSAIFQLDLQTFRMRFCLLVGWSARPRLNRIWFHINIIIIQINWFRPFPFSFHSAINKNRYVFSAPGKLLESLPGTLMLTDCLEACQSNDSCGSVNYETGLCVLFSSNADKLPGNFPIDDARALFTYLSFFTHIV